MSHDDRTVQEGERARACDEWLAATMAHFREAAELADAKPHLALQEVRKVVEGWAYVVCVALEPDFRPYRRPKRRRDAGPKDLFSKARDHWPPSRGDVLTGLKALGNEAHHNQGYVQRPSPSVAYAAVVLCGDLLSWVHQEVLHRPVPPELVFRSLAEQVAPIRDAVHSLNETMKELDSPPRWKKGLLIVGLLGLGWFLGITTPKEDAKSVIRDVRPTGGSAQVPVLTSAPSAGAAEPEAVLLPKQRTALDAVREYEARLAGRDLGRLTASHRFPLKRWFGSRDVSETEVMKGYAVWFAANARKISFEACAEVRHGVVRCDARLDPPLEHHPAPVPTCLVFDDDGLLISRTELEQVPECPPAFE